MLRKTFISFAALRVMSKEVAPAAYTAVRGVETSTYQVGQSTDIKWHEGGVPRQDKEKLLNQKGCILWFTGLSGSGKSTVACSLEHALKDHGKTTVLLDGDNVRHGLNSNLGFSAEDRKENIRRIGEVISIISLIYFFNFKKQVSKLFAENGIITLVSFISPYRADRQAVRDRVSSKDFIEIYMKIPIEVCEQRDPKGLYKLAREGKIKSFTGITDPYEEPENAEVIVEVKDKEGNHMSPELMARQILNYLNDGKYLTS